MKKLLLSLLIGTILFSACKKDSFTPVHTPVEEPVIASCKFQTENPAGHSYTAESLVVFTTTEKHCGILPLSSRNYWVYEDSIFDNGSFLKVQLDTLRYTLNKKSLSDGLTWWESNISIGLPETLYANDSAFFTMADRLFAPGVKDVKKDFIIPSGDSVKYLASFDDAAANGRSLKMKSPVTTPAGTFNDCIYFEKNARYYRKDQVFYKPGLGVVKYIQEKALPGTMVIKLQQISTLVAMHIE